MKNYKKGHVLHGIGWKPKNENKKKTLLPRAIQLNKKEKKTQPIRFILNAKNKIE